MGPAMLFALAVTGGCATGEPIERDRDPDIREIARALGCSSTQVAVCVEVNCDPEDYVCAERGEMRDLFDPKIVR